MTIAASPAAGLAAELQSRVNMFNAGDEKYSGAWLVEFQRADGAWEVCFEALRHGPQSECEGELMQEFCAQTLARLARTFPSRLPADVQRCTRDGLQALLEMHARGPPCVWKQLALALASADLWLGSWAAVDALAASSMPAVCFELLSLPTELLFCDRALPLSDRCLRQSAASALLQGCPRVFDFLLGGECPAGQEARAMTVLASWLRAIRKSLRWLPTGDETMPLRCVASHGQELITMVRIAPAEAIEVAQQLVRWKLCDEDLAAVLQPFLGCLFDASAGLDQERMLPLLGDLAANCWPRAALGDFSLDWQAVAAQAVKALEWALADVCDETSDAEAALAVWQTFATTVRDGVHLPQEIQQGEEATGGERPQPMRKRTRTRQVGWQATPEQISASQELSQLFGLLVRTLLQLLRLPAWANEDTVVSLWTVRETARSLLESWGELLDASQEWHEAALTPVSRVGQLLAGGADGAGPAPDEWGEAEVSLWLSATVAACRPGHAASEQAAGAVLGLGQIDAAPQPWRIMMGASSCTLASAGPQEQTAVLARWMLQRPPRSCTESTAFLELFELAYAEAMETVCSKFPSAVVHVDTGEQLFRLAFATWPPSCFHQNSAEAQRRLLRATWFAMGSDIGLLCQAISTKALPLLLQEVDAEASSAASEVDPPWHAVQALFSTLAITLPAEPTAGTDHPGLPLWRQHWNYIEAALLRWPVSSSTDQPAQAACTALVSAVRGLPALLPEALRLLTASAAQSALPDAQVGALRDVARGAPCPPLDATTAAGLLKEAITNVVGNLLLRAEVPQSPQTVTGIFELLSDAMRHSPEVAGAGLCDDRLRPMLVAEQGFLSRCLAFVGAVLPESSSAEAARAMMVFVSHLVGDREELLAKNNPLASSLPCLYSGIACALAAQEHLEDLENLGDVAETLCRLADAFPAEAAAALAGGLDAAQAPATIREQLLGHVSRRGEWQRGEWLEELKQIVCEWHSERRKYMP
eukprot:CAMPEP_0170612744 /NCGR_PEP_ID=MMETSP0224-20130122/23888_1 /TAXON_ID=285029 /ORGANISM="Togula jolla, Strain CCCM 725" /LENGTH=990 /DNA_ID=CAMNT_0010938271 /DNA_START=9 /DNA_END=2981 /DNA_ORIENTATION=+